MSDWYDKATLADECTFDTKCPHCEPNGDCEPCGTIDGRFMEVVNQYASTCDWCGEMAMHEDMNMHEKTQLGICGDCRKKGLDVSVFDGLEAHV